MNEPNDDDESTRGAPSDVEADRDDRPRAPSAPEGVRIAAVEAAVAAGLVPSTGRRFNPAAHSDQPVLPPVPPLELPDWSDPPTGQVPRILLDEDGNYHGEDGVVMRGPTWREDRADWEQDLDLSFLVSEDEELTIAEHASRDELADDPFNFSFEDLEPPTAQRHSDGAPTIAVEVTHPVPSTGAAPLLGDEDELADAAWDSLLNAGVRPALRGVEPRLHRKERRSGKSSLRGGRRATDPPALAGDAPTTGFVESAHGLPGEPSSSLFRRDRKPRPSHALHKERRPEREKAAASPHRRNPYLATATGVVAGGIALGCFALGPVCSLALVAVLVTLAAGEAFSAMRRSGLTPLAPLGLVAIPALAVAAYLRGTQAVVIVFGIAVLLGFCWYVAVSARSDDARRRPVINLGATYLVLAWVGFLGSFAGLLLSPHTYPHRHGVALLVGAGVLAVASDVGAYATGARFGRHPLAKRISPNKSWEGFAGGTVLALAAAALIVARVHPFTLGHALVLGVIVCIVAPIGDLAESLVKRDLKIKDMGSLLPAHGGVLDRVDGLLFVLPVTYFLAHLIHLA